MSKKDEKENDDAEIEEEESDEDIKDKENMIDNVEQKKLKKQTNKNKQIIIDKKAKQNKKNNIKKFHINKNFEKEILATYKKLSKINKYKDDLKEEGEEGEEEEEMIESQIKSDYHLCEKNYVLLLKFVKVILI